MKIPIFHLHPELCIYFRRKKVICDITDGLIKYWSWGPIRLDKTNGKGRKSQAWNREKDCASNNDINHVYIMSMIRSESRTSWIVWQDCCIVCYYWTAKKTDFAIVHLHMLLWNLNLFTPQKLHIKLWTKFWFSEQNSGVPGECIYRWIQDQNHEWS